MTDCYFIGGPLDDTTHDIEDTVTVYKMPKLSVKWTETNGEIDHVYEREGHWVTDTDLRKMGYVKVVEPCGTCNGSGVMNECMCDLEVFQGEGYGLTPEQHQQEFHRCPDCGGRGWQPAEGTCIDGFGNQSTEPYLWVPLSKLVGDD
jgi:hypothetical protein